MQMQDCIEKEGLSFIWVKESAGRYHELFDTYRRFYDIYLHELRGYSSSPIPDRLLPPEENPDLYLVLVRDKDKDIGILSFSLYPLALSGHDLHIGDVYVYYLYRRKGYASHMLSLLIKAAEFQSYDFSFEILDNNTPALNLAENVFDTLGYDERLVSIGFDAMSHERKDLRFYYYIKI